MRLLTGLFVLFFFGSSAQESIQIIKDKLENSNEFEAHFYEFDEKYIADLFAFLKENRAESLPIEFPLADGSKEIFIVKHNNLIPPALQAKFPTIVSLDGYNAQTGATAKFDFGPNGFHGFVLHPEQSTTYIDPIEFNGQQLYMVYHKNKFQDYFKEDVEFSCGTVATQIKMNETPQAFGQNRFKSAASSSTIEKRVYRLAVSTTGEFTQFFGSVANALAAINTTMNRVNGVYEREFAISMELIPNNDLIIFTNPNTDPFSGSNGNHLSQNQQAVNQIIGSANYDIGHVFTRQGGGIASLGSVCRNGAKASGVTGRSNPQGDPFDIDYVAHEMGHQFGANHTQNNNCNRNGSTAFEPGSGSTIMGYAGICSPNLQNNSDDYFHAGSYDEIMAFTTTGDGSNCPVKSIVPNNLPQIQVKDKNFTIPKETPFYLTASATDADGDLLTYCWEQMDLGPSTPPNNPSSNAPMFRSVAPTTESTRFLPRKTMAILGINVTGENFPTYQRNLNFRLSVRDNHPGSGHIAQESVQLTVNENLGPLQVNTPNLTSGPYERGAAVEVNWAVNNTNQLAPFVHILYSPDQGFTWTDTLAKNVLNSGSANVILPTSNDNAPVIIVAAANQYFYNASQRFTTTNPSDVISGPINLQAAIISAATVELNWDDMANNESGYVIQRSQSNAGNFINIDTVIGNTTRYLDIGVNLTYNYFYRVYAYNSIAQSGTSNEVMVMSTGIENDYFSNIKVYPNPLSNLLTIENASPNTKIAIFDISGRLVYENVSNGNAISLNTNEWSDGLYFLQMINNQRTIQKKMVKKSL